MFGFEDCVLDTDRRELRRGGNLVPLEPQVFDLLEYLIRNRERVVSRDDLTESIWRGRIVSESALSTRLNAARKAIADGGAQQRLIKTLPRKGLRFVGTVREAPDTVSPRSVIKPPDQPSVAVLPFANMSGDPEQEYFADGVADEIITALSRCNWLFTIARNSSFTYKGRTVDVREIGRDLGVRYVLEGSVRRAGERLRITGQLIDAESGVEIWADRFDGDATEIFALQDRVTESVVGAIEPRLQLAEFERLGRNPARSLDAYDLLLRAQALEYEYTEASLEAALQALEQAIAIDPHYAPAMALAAYCHAERRQQGWSKNADADTEAGLRLALRSLELCKDDANVLWMAAFAVRVLGADPHRARELVNRSLQLNPNSTMALTTAAFAEVFLGNSVRALEMLQRAERLSPRDPKAWYSAAAAALAHFVGEGYEEAATAAKKALAQNPRFAPTLRVLAASLARVGNKEGAAQAMRELLSIEPDLTLGKLRARLTHMETGALSRFAGALRLAGLPD